MDHAVSLLRTAACLAYLAVFLAAGWLAARRALPDASPGTVLPLGCAFGVSGLAALPALAALALGFRLPAVLLAGALALAAAVLLWRGGQRCTPLPPLRRDPGDAAQWACVLPLLALTIWLLHTHILREVDGTYHTGQSCYGDLSLIHI